MIQNQLQVAIHKYIFEILKENYSKHNNVITRISHYMVTENDAKELISLISDIYESAYTKALQNYHSQLEAAGYKIALSYTSNK